jgi:hypothetical protein
VAICYGSDPTTCPMRAWPAMAGSDGPLFRGVNKVGAIAAERLKTLKDAVRR